MGATRCTARLLAAGMTAAKSRSAWMLGSAAASAFLLAGPPLAADQPDVVIANQMHTSLVFELHSVLDEVVLYAGDPQYLFRLDLRPAHSLPPKIEFSNTNQAAVLRVLDLWFLETQQQQAEPPEDWEDYGEPEPRKPIAQGWEVQVSPASATDFFLQCDGGKGTFDFTDLPVRAVHLLADTTRIQVDFNRANPIPLARFKLTVREGQVVLHEFLNARAQSTTLQVNGSKVDLDLIGTLTPGETDLFVEGVPRELQIAVSKDIGLHVEGPAATAGRFDRQGFELRGLALESGDYAGRRTRLRLYFSQAVPKLKVQWED